MKKTSKMVMVAVALLAGVSGTAWANGTEMPPEPSTYTPPPPPPAPEYRPVAAHPIVMNKNSGPYISGAVGIGFPEKAKLEDDEIDLDEGVVVNGAIGYNFGTARVEGALGYQQHDLSDDAYDDHVSLLTVMANAYYDFNTGTDVRPYIMGGLGLAHADMSWTSENHDVFAWQLGAGVGFKVAKQTTLDIGYRYLKPDAIDIGEGDEARWAVHNVMVGLRYQF